MNELFKEKFKEITGIQESTISTVDHVYASIPIRLIDSHHRLMQLGDVKVIIWDSIYPKIKKSRTDLVLDSGIFVPNNTKYFIFPTNQLQGKSLVLKPDLDGHLNELGDCMDLVLNYPKYKKATLKKTYLDRFQTLMGIYSKIINENPGISSSEFYKKLVVEIYKFLGFADVAEFYNTYSQSFMQTAIIKEFVPWLIENSKNTPFGLDNLINNSSLIAPPYFTYTNNLKTINQFNPSQAIEIIESLREGILLPCKEIIYWVLSLSGIKHFGRDFNFFAQLEEFYKTKYNIETGFSKLQLTQGKNDGSFYIQFEQDISCRLVSINNKIKAKKSPIPQKGADVSTIPSVYMHIGNRFKEIYEDFIKSKNTRFIKMGEIKL